jgi:hypothetical protein
MLIAIILLINYVSAIKFGVYSDSSCNHALLKSDVYINACTYKDEYFFNLKDCHTDNILLDVNNITTAESLGNLLITTNCIELYELYFKIIERVSVFDSIIENNCYI